MLILIIHEKVKSLKNLVFEEKKLRLVGANAHQKLVQSFKKVPYGHRIYLKDSMLLTPVVCFAELI